MLRVALVHDWLTGMRGGEWVLAEIAELFPEAPIYTLVHRPGSIDPRLATHSIHTSWLQTLSFGGRKWRPLLPLMPAAVESFTFPNVDLVISTSHCVAKGVIPPRGAFHVSFIHTPMRYAWDQRDIYVHQLPRLLQPLVQLQLARLRQWDVVSAARVDRLLANSRLVAWRIRHYWNRHADVLPPPVDTNFFTIGEERGKNLLMVAALVPYKRVELAVEVAQALGRTLDVVGTGPLERRLRRMAGSNARFHGWVSRERLRELYRSSASLIVPNVEDFGMASVEALACGTPVVGLVDSGTADVVRSGSEGELAEEPSATALVQAAKSVLEREWDRAALAKRAHAFSREQFRLRFLNLLDRVGLQVQR